MATMTLLQMTQNILSAMNSDVVDTINATPESTQVAQHIEDVYLKIMTEKHWPHLQVLDQLTGLGDATQATKMQMPSGTSDINWIKYDVRTTAGSPRAMRDIKYLTPYEFVSMVTNRDVSQANVTAFTDSASTVPLHIYNDVAPTYWTSFDDEFIWFDSYNSALEATLQESKTVIHIIKEPVWTAADTFVPDLPSHMFPALLAQAKSTCFNYVKQAPSALEDRDVKRQRVTLQKKGRREQKGNERTLNYGR